MVFSAAFFPGGGGPPLPKLCLFCLAPSPVFCTFLLLLLNDWLLACTAGHITVSVKLHVCTSYMYVPASAVPGVKLVWPHKMFINPRRACTARVTVVGFVCVCVCVCVCLLSQISPLEHLFVLKYCHVLSGQRRSKNLWGFL